jgi:hypothetical protein
MASRADSRKLKPSNEYFPSSAWPPSRVTFHSVTPM